MEIEIFGIPYLKKGKKIHIKKKNRGKFTKSAKAAGQSVQEHARSVLNDPHATPLLKKRANFARNAAKWKHLFGGILKGKTGLTLLPRDYKLEPWYEDWMGAKGLYYQIIKDEDQRTKEINRDRPAGVKRYTNIQLQKEQKRQQLIKRHLKSLTNLKSNKTKKITNSTPSMDKARQLIQRTFDSEKSLREGIKDWYVTAQQNQIENALDNWYKYKLLMNSLATAAELYSAGSILSNGYKSLKASRLNVSPDNLLNVDMDTDLMAASTMGTIADAYQLLTAENTSDKIENSAELTGDISGIIGGSNWFRNTPFFGKYGNTIDNILDFSGYTAAGYDFLLKPLSEIFKSVTDINLIEHPKLNKKLSGVVYKAFKNPDNVNVPFMRRILDSNRQTIPDWKVPGLRATHKLAYALMGTPGLEYYIVYPQVQEINGQLHDFTDPKYNHKPFEDLQLALWHNNTITFNSEKDAKAFTEEYKKYFNFNY